MKRPSSTLEFMLSSTTVRWAALVGFLAVVQLGGCTCDDKTGGPVKAPAGLNDKFSVNPPPELVTDPKLAVSGRGLASTSVFYELNSADAALFAQVNSFETWSGEMTLEEGPNTMTFHPRDASGAMGNPSMEFVVTLDTTAPGAPTLSATPPECIGTPTYVISGTTEPGATIESGGQVYTTDDNGNFMIEVTLTGASTSVELTAVDAAGNKSEAITVTLKQGIQNPTVDPIPQVIGEAVQTITGTKAAGTGIWLTWAGGATENIVAVDDQTTWSAEITFPDGESSFTLEARDAAGTASCGSTEAVTVRLSNVCPVTVDDSGFTSPTRNPILPVPGAKCAGTAVYLFHEGETFEEAVEVVALNNDANFSFDLTLEEGVNTFYVLLRDGDDLPGPVDGPFTVVLDTIPPAAPLYSPEPPAQYLDFNITLEGTKDNSEVNGSPQRVNICRRVDQEVDCAQVVDFNASATFNFDQMLHPDPALNFICISSFDEAGNQSAETCATIEQGAGDGVQIVSPANGSILGDVPITVAALTNSTDCTINRVQICVDTDCTDATNSVGNRYEAEVQAGNFDNGSVHAIIATAFCDNNTIAGVDQITVLYIIDGILLSNSVSDKIGARPRIAQDGRGVIHAVWHDDCAGNDACLDSQDGSLPYDVYHRSFENGVWSDVTLVSNSVGDADSRNPAMVASPDGNIHVVWQDNGNVNGSGGDFDILYRSYNATSRTWSAVTVVTDHETTPANTHEDEFAELAVDTNGVVHVVWQAAISGQDRDIFYRTIDGATHGPVLTISDQDGNLRSENPIVAVDSSDLAYVAWQDTGDVMGSGTDADVYLRTVDHGVAGATIVISDNNLDQDSRFPDITVDGTDVLHIVWQDTATLFGSGTDLDIFYRSFDFYAEAALRLSPYSLVTGHANDDASQEPAITFDESANRVFVAWAELGDLDGSGADADIYYSVGVDGTFNPSLRVTANAFNRDSEWPDLLFDTQTDTLHIVWEDDSSVGGDTDTATSTTDDRDVFYLGITL